MTASLRGVKVSNCQTHITLFEQWYIKTEVTGVLNLNMIEFLEKMLVIRSIINYLQNIIISTDHLEKNLFTGLTGTIMPCFSPSLGVEFSQVERNIL